MASVDEPLKIARVIPVPGTHGSFTVDYGDGDVREFFPVADESDDFAETNAGKLIAAIKAMPIEQLRAELQTRRDYQWLA